MRRVIAAKQDAAGLQRGVVGDGDVAGAVEQLEQPAGAPGLADVEKEVVPYLDAPRLLAWMIVVLAKHVDAAAGMPDDVVDEGDVFDRRPWRAAVLVADREENGEAVLRLRPDPLEHVAFNEHAPGVLQLEQVLD